MDWFFLARVSGLYWQKKVDDCIFLSDIIRGGLRKSRRIMHKQLFRYHTYILRFWQEQEAAHEDGKWRFTLLDPTQGHRYGFSSLDDLMVFVREQMKEE